jgi:predicted DNA-binding transcriptional regulator AlpA
MKTNNSEILRPKEIQEILGGVSRSYLDQLAQTDPDFPRVIKLSSRFTGYRKTKILDWLEKKEMGAA